MIDLGRKYTRDTVSPWPGMSAQDTIIWIRGISIVTQPGDVIYYDVHIGTQRDIGPGIPPEIALMWQRVNQKRIDLVIHRGDIWYIVEVRHVATSAALGRLIQYQKLWHHERPSDDTVLLLVTDWIDPDLPPLLLTNQISYLVI